MKNNTIKENSQLKIGVVLSYINLFVGNLIPVFYTPVMLSLLGQSEYGLYKLSSSVTSYLSLISLGIGSAVTRYLIKYRVSADKEEEEKILGLFMIIFRVIALATIVIGTVLTLNLDIWYSQSLTETQLRRMQIIVFLMVCNMAINFLLSPYTSVVTAHEKFVFQQSMNIMLTCITPIINLLVLWAGYASIGMAISSLAINILVQFLYLLYVRNKMQIRARYVGLPKYLIKEILGFSFWVFVSNVVSQLYNATDTVMIGSVPALATTGTAVYSVGITLVNVVGSMSTSLSSILSPKTNRMVFEGRNNGELTDFAITVGRFQAYIVALLGTGFIAFGKPFIYFYAGEEYLEAYWVAIFIMIPNMIPPLQNVCLNIIVAQNRHRFRSLIYLGIAILNVFGTWILMQYFGVTGAALMSGIALFLGAGIIMNWYYWKIIGLDIPRFWKNVGRIFFIPFIMCIVTIVLSHYINFYNLMNMCIGIVVYTIVYIVLNWKLQMNKYEKGLFYKPLQVILSKAHAIIRSKG